MSLELEFAASLVKDSEGISPDNKKWWLTLKGEERQAKIRGMFPLPAQIQEVSALIRPGNMSWQDTHLVVGRLCGLEEAMASLISNSAPVPDGIMPLWIPEGLTANSLMGAHAGIAGTDGKSLKVETYGIVDFDATYQPYPSDRRSSQTLLLKDEQEAEHIWGRKSVDWVLAHNKNHHGLMLHQRLLAGLVYYLVKGQHLDQTYWTDCLGSRTTSGDVPSVSFHYGRVRVGCYRAGHGYSDVRSRSDGVS
ncbi:MAG: hypothetical protein A2822_02430 [Candidatus Staskawiczbacteria bacterium RIFCSPHIGHO2_01_FULL_41_41]|uniref:Uncharacterized protein n=1 Tax=Candidatus Staskawiczbacteria bacterium RIFCSPHIGHO2_01_FULL_41_41 TaxID=1802203 RepID=A0A1G2HTZ7_9BACT|nr:MAG: hypothetical protein A2822_02430 [Candidatus Staskawiczbacteria bacterium RIFCSPHIGHO2_01_FULL_41_41]OGZ74538.1 MAG: hypothetical protein A3A12_02125 [Candidatus Staskawiczbacteria bacterium RIFCSPLOWO2_01_FULL_43_17b]